MQLVLTQNFHTNTQYTALSHVWRDPSTTAPLITAQKHILQSRLNGIELSELPANFRDAITVSPSLGVRYLWIDSQCIIQDDPVDWDFETKRMLAVYANSYITIAAVSAKCAHNGFLNPRPAPRLAEIPYVSLNGQRQGKFCLATETRFYPEPMGYFHSDQYFIEKAKW